MQNAVQSAMPSEPSMVSRQWYALYTCPNHEKRIAAELEARAVESFLPLYRSVRRWKDRRVSLELPLFPGYVFVCLALRDRLPVVQVPGVVRLVGFGGVPAALPEGQVAVLRASLDRRLHAEPHPFLAVGHRVRITCGPLAGLEGVLRRKKNSFRFVLSIELIQRSFAVEVDSADVQKIRGAMGLAATN